MVKRNGDAMKIGLAQMNIIWEDKKTNKETCLSFLEEAKNKKIDFLVFPEMTLTGFTMNVDRLGDTNNESVDWFKEQSKTFNLNTAFGYPSFADGIGENHMSIVSSNGEELVNYTKIHPFSFGREAKYYRGGNNIVFTNLAGFAVSPLICYDLRFPEVFQIASKNAELIIVIANWPYSRREHWITLLKARAIENQCYIAGVNRVGSEKNLSYSGDSMVIDPLGNVLAQGGNNEVLIEAEISSNFVLKVREEFKVKSDRKEDLYTSYFMKTK
jgi:omega-amidase